MTTSDGLKKEEYACEMFLIEFCGRPYGAIGSNYPIRAYRVMPSGTALDKDRDLIVEHLHITHNVVLPDINNLFEKFEVGSIQKIEPVNIEEALTIIANKTRSKEKALGNTTAEKTSDTLVEPEKSKSKFKKVIDGFMNAGYFLWFIVSISSSQLLPFAVVWSIVMYFTAFLIAVVDPSIYVWIPFILMLPSIAVIAKEVFTKPNG